jgi:hypothetical protein
MYSLLGVLTIVSADGIETWAVDEPLIVGQGYMTDENPEVHDSS